jgi:hypothetical protein
VRIWWDESRACTDRGHVPVLSLPMQPFSPRLPARRSSGTTPATSKSWAATSHHHHSRGISRISSRSLCRCGLSAQPAAWMSRRSFGGPLLTAFATSITPKAAAGTHARNTGETGTRTRRKVSVKKSELLKAMPLLDRLSCAARKHAV